MSKDNKGVYIKSIERKSVVTDTDIFENINGKSYCEQELYSEDLSVNILFSDGTSHTYEFYYYRGELNHFVHLIHSIIYQVSFFGVECTDIKQVVEELYNRFDITERVKECEGINNGNEGKVDR